MAKFELGNTLAEVLGNVSETDTAPEQIVLLPLASIDADEKNFYSVEGIEELAANIELIGLLDPLRVRENPDMPGRYLIVSGHRRRAALWTLYEEDPEKWGKAPCIVEKPAASPEMQELRLIYANANTRAMSSADLAAQAERVEMLLYKLKEQGVEFPGRMRDHVAEACRISATKLAELAVIRKNLSGQLLREWESGNLNHTCAYELARTKPEVREQLLHYWTGAEIAEKALWWIQGKINYISSMLFRKCKEHDGLCENASVMIEKKLAHPNAYNYCEWAKCCMDCSELAGCKSACLHAAEKKKELQEAKSREREEAKAREKVLEAEIAEEEANELRENTEAWKRMDQAATRAGLTTEDLLSALEISGLKYQDEKIIEEAKRRITGTWDNQKDGAGSCPDHPFAWVDVWDLPTIADKLHCSTDYLLGRTDDPTPSEPAPQELISVDERYPAKGQFVMAFTRWLVPIPSVYFRAAFMDFTEKSVGNVRLTGIEWWAPMPQLPAGKKWPGQETIEGMVKK